MLAHTRVGFLEIRHVIILNVRVGFKGRQQVGVDCIMIRSVLLY